MKDEDKQKPPPADETPTDPRPQPHPLEKWIGFLKHLKGQDPDELVREMRGD